MKVALIGLDGATFDVILPLIRQGELPVLKGLIENGVHANLTSTVPAVTPAAWVSSFTGTNPGKHGIFDFSRLEGTSLRLVNSTDIYGPTLWDILNNEKLKTIIINVPMTYPPSKVDGAMISGMFVPAEGSDYIYPRELKQAIADIGFRIEPKRYFLQFYSDKAGLARDILQMSDMTCAACLYLLKRLEWDFLMVVFTAPDRVQHFYWKYMDTTHPQYDSRGKKYAQVIPNVYRDLDSIVGRLVGSFGDDTITMIMSDHGFGRVHTDLYVNRLLIQLKLLHLKIESSSRLSDNAQRLALRLLETVHLRSFMKSSFAFRVGKALQGSQSSLEESIDFEHTKAFFPSRSGQYVQINLKGREPKGIVEPGSQYDSLVGYLATELCNLRDTRSGAAIIERVHRKEDIYSGPQTSKTPDLFLVPTDGYELASELSKGELLLPAREKIADISGGHRPDGVLIIAGPNIRRGLALEHRANIVDVAPTVLYACGVHIPKDMDGKLLSEVFDHDYLQSNPPKYSDATSVSNQSAKSYSAEEEQEIMQRLRALGYA